MDLPVTVSQTRAALIAIDRCRATLPEGDPKHRLTEAEEWLIEGLLIGWNQSDPNWRTRPRLSLQLALAERDLNYNGQSISLDNPPQVYLKSLANDAAICRSALESSNTAPAQAMLESVIADIAIKAQDCARNGMGRTIEFKVKTMKGETPDRGWTVYYRWLTVSNLVADEMPFPKTSTPAFDDLPPGLYRFRAEKRVLQSESATTSEIKMCQVDEDHRECEIQVP